MLGLLKYSIYAVMSFAAFMLPFIALYLMFN